MKWLIVVIMVCAIVYFLAKSAKTSGRRKTGARGPTRPRVKNDLAWLEDRWKLAETQREKGSSGMFPRWYFDQATERQLAKLDELGVPVKRRGLTKGQASDLIGIHEPPEEASLEVLRFFKVATRGMNETKARHEVALIFADEAKARAWKNRPASEIQKAFLAFFDLKHEKGITHAEASVVISNQESALAEKKDPLLDEWEAFEEIIDELADPGFREDYEIKKPTIVLVKRALDDLHKEGKSYRAAAEEIDIVVDKMISLKPSLRRG